MARFATLCSGSSGNSAYIGKSDGAGILIDAGVNCKRISAALTAVGGQPDMIRALFVTHEHVDHVSAVRVLCNRYHIPVFATEGTLGAMRRQGRLDGDFEVNIMPAGTSVTVAGICVTSFKTSHDSADSCGYTALLPDERKIAVLTDTGFVTPEAYAAVRGSDLILLESNHDEHMLLYGPYDMYLKQRIRGKQGHLSNRDCADAAVRFVRDGTSRLILAHLSRENNTPEKAFDETNKALTRAGYIQNRDYFLSVAPAGACEAQIIF